MLPKNARLKEGKNIEFRQAIFLRDEFHHWHYWGFIDGAFVGPETNISSPSEALKHSQMFTTLLDKNNTRIYGGDIVDSHSPLYPLLRIWKVIYRDCGFTLKHIHQFAHTTVISDYCEIIGNIYENPELLQGMG